MTTSVGVVCAHPDDEVLGCGGTIARLADTACEVHIFILAEGITSRDAARNTSSRRAEMEALRAASLAAAKVLGAHSVTYGGFPDNRMDGLELLDVVKRVESFLHEKRVEHVFTHHSSDLNVDHRVVHQAVATACRPVPGARVRTALCFEVPSSSEWQTSGVPGAFAPAWYEDIESTLGRKLEALKCYASEMRPWPHARSYEAVEALARWRGANVGRRAAEAFQVLRHING